MADIQQKLNIISKKEEEDFTKIRAKNLNLPYLDLSFFPINISSLRLISEDASKKAKIIVLDRIGNHITLGCYSSENPNALAIINSFKDKGMKVDVYIISNISLNKAWGYYQKTQESETLEDLVIIPKNVFDSFNEHVKNIGNVENILKGQPATEVIQDVLAAGIKTQAGDVHIESYEDIGKIRFRIDGILQDVADISKDMYTQILNRLKLTSGVNLNITNAAQDGRFSIHVVKDSDILEKVDVRISFLPEKDQESIVMRLLGVGVQKLNLETLGLRNIFYEILKKEAKKANGMILVTGPTGSGKTTTLYGVLNYLNQPEVKIITIEDPIEYIIDGITQTQVSDNYSFVLALRAILRQNPNIIMVGEIRDEETAKTAVESALTGHLVLSTLHTNSAVGTVSRLEDFGISERLISASLNVAIAQRLVRKLCTYCKKQKNPDNIELRKIRKVLDTFPEKLKNLIPQNINNIYYSEGCDHCFGLGYQGREPIMETAVITENVRSLINSKGGNDEIAEEVSAEGNLTMTQDGILKVLEGVTDIKEVERAVGEIEV